jgi:NADH:ubiquinone oxidoreductase subunit 6 (subunit J)
MSFLEALYGSQYYEIHLKGKDGNKGRLNGNFFLAAMIILFLIDTVFIFIHFAPGFAEVWNNTISNSFGTLDGKSIGKLLGILLFAIIYFVLIKTVGSKESFKRKVENFMQYPDEIKKKANTKLLAPFFVLLGLLIVMIFIK